MAAAKSLVASAMAYGLSSIGIPVEGASIPCQRRRGRHLEHAHHAERGGDRRQERLLVLPDGPPLHVDAPELRRAGPVAQRFERDGNLDDPFVVGAAGFRVPDGVPVPVRGPLVGHRGVEQPAQRIRDEDVAVAPIVEGVEDDGEAVVAEHAGAVALHLVRHDPARFREPAARRDVQRVVVEHDPRLGRLRRGLAGVRFLLHEIGDRRHGAVHRFVEPAIELQRRVQADGPHRHVVAGVGLGVRRGRQRADQDRRGAECDWEPCAAGVQHAVGCRLPRAGRPDFAYIMDFER